MDLNRSEILFPINALVCKDLMELPQSFSQNLEDLVEENLIEQFIHLTIEEKQFFYSKSFNPDTFVVTEPFSLDINLFN